MSEEQNDLSMFTLLDDNQNPIKTTTYVGDKEPMKDYSTETSQLSTSSSSIDPPLVT